MKAVSLSEASTGCFHKLGGLFCGCLWDKILIHLRSILAPLIFRNSERESTLSGPSSPKRLSPKLDRPTAQTVLQGGSLASLHPLDLTTIWKASIAYHFGLLRPSPVMFRATWPSRETPGFSSPLGPKDHINISISHSGSKAQYKVHTRNHVL